MAAALPVAKLAALLIKTLAKPVSKRIKHEFSRSELTQNLLIQIGQVSHQVTSRLTIWSSGYKVLQIKPLEEEKALKTGSEFIGEAFIYSVSAYIVIWEYQRSKEKEQSKEEQRRAQAKAERQELQQQLHALDVRVQAMEQVVKANNDSILRILSPRTQKYQAPDSKELVPIQSGKEDENENQSTQQQQSKQQQQQQQTSSSWWRRFSLW